MSSALMNNVLWKIDDRISIFIKNLSNSPINPKHLHNKEPKQFYFEIATK